MKFVEGMGHYFRLLRGWPLQAEAQAETLALAPVPQRRRHRERRYVGYQAEA